MTLGDDAGWLARPEVMKFSAARSWGTRGSRVGPGAV